jgi:hypothetical protein
MWMLPRRQGSAVKKENRMLRLLGALLRMSGEIAVVESVTQAVRSLAIDAALAALAGMCGISVLGCLAAALWIWGDAHYGPVMAPLMVAGMFAVLALAGLLALARPKRRGGSKARHAVRVASDQALQPVKLMGAAARGFVQGLAGETPSRP